MLTDIVGLMVCGSCVGNDSYSEVMSGMVVSHPDDGSPLHPLTLKILLPIPLRCFLSLTVVDINV